MPLDVLRLRDSTLAIKCSGEEFRAAVLLWCASWHQIPAGSLPDDDAELATFAGFGRVVKEFKKIRTGALRGWVKHSDGRLYHAVVTEKVLDAWDGKLRQQWRTECARIRKHNERHGTSHKSPDFEDWKSCGCLTGQSLAVTCDSENMSHATGAESHARQTPLSDVKSTPRDSGQGQGQGQSTYSDTGVSGGKPPAPMSPDEIIFGYGVPLLTGSGTAEKQARSFLGGLRKQHGDKAVIDKLRECLREKPLEPLKWLAAALPPTGGTATGKGRGVVSLADQNRQASQEAKQMLFGNGG